MKQVFTTYENGNASVEILPNSPDDFIVTVRMGAAYIMLNSDMRELIDLRNKLSELIHEVGLSDQG